MKSNKKTSYNVDQKYVGLYVPDELYAIVKKTARLSGRSLASEIRLLLEKTYKNNTENK
jgi:hypothetical protein